jgi:hypothetical protein
MSRWTEDAAIIIGTLSAPDRRCRFKPEGWI